MEATPPKSLVRLLEGLNAVARSDVRDYVETLPDGSVRLDLRKAEEAGTLWLVRDLRVGPGGFSLELHDKLLAMSLLLRCFALLEARAAAPEPVDLPAGFAIPEVPKPPRRRKLPAVA